MIRKRAKTPEELAKDAEAKALKAAVQAFDTPAPDGAAAEPMARPEPEPRRQD
jgi:hypothetical protein